MTQFPFYLAAFVGVLGVLILIHELGHYLAARACGVKVLRFSVGFGRPLCARVLGRDRTEWVLAVFPLGGYVRMLDEREAPVPAGEQARAFNRQTVGRRSLIVVAGPLANLLLAVLLYWGIFFAGSEEWLPVLGSPPAASAAALAGLQDGEEVLSVDAVPVQSYADLRWQLLTRGLDGGEVRLEVVNAQRERQVRHLSLAEVQASDWSADPLEALGLRLYRPAYPAVIGQVAPAGAGARAGLQAQDRILAVAGQPVSAWHEVVRAVRASPDAPLSLLIERAGVELTLLVQPDGVEERGQRIGKLGVAVADPGDQVRPIRGEVRYDFLEAGRRALAETWEKSWFSLHMLGRMLLGEVSWRNLSGPITIADYAGQSARMGLGDYLKFMALVSISLGVLNLLPIPVLDGGHLMYHMMEVVRGRPLSERAMATGQQIGLFLLGLLMAFAFYNDLTRLFSG